MVPVELPQLVNYLLVNSSRESRAEAFLASCIIAEALADAGLLRCAE
jgi:hypothetical protein